MLPASASAAGIYESPCVESIPLSQLTGARVWCKLDYLQRTGSFKERGARNALLRLPESQRTRGVVAASAAITRWASPNHGSPAWRPRDRGDAPLRAADQGDQLRALGPP